MGSCVESLPAFRAGSGGCVFAVSSVAGGSESFFMDASGSGDDVFIATADQLVPSSDTDSREDVYDVRVDGGFPVTAAPPVCMSADSCKPSVSQQPGVFGVPASATFSGVGNLVPSSSRVVCAKSKRLVRGRCVAKQKKRKVKVKRVKARRVGGGREVWCVLVLVDGGGWVGEAVVGWCACVCWVGVCAGCAGCGCWAWGAEFWGVGDGKADA